MADRIEYKLKTLIDSGNKTWASILTNMGYEMEKDGKFNWPFEENTIALTIVAQLKDETTSTPITIYLHNCTFEEPHVLHSSNNVDSYNQAWIEAEEQSQQDNKMHFAPDWRTE